LENKLTLHRRVPDNDRLDWAKGLVAKMKGRGPKTRPEVYAHEQIYLHENPVRELKLQVMRIGELGITAIPCEVYGITGLKIKAQSPLPSTFNIELAGGAEGYIPPPEQHVLGGYSTWPARTAALEREAEPKIVEKILSMLEQVSGRPREKAKTPQSAYDRAVLSSKPLAYWPMDEFRGPWAFDASGDENRAAYEDGVVFYLGGPAKPGLSDGEEACRAAHFAGGRMKAQLAAVKGQYAIEMWMWNGLPADARDIAGFLFARGSTGKEQAGCDQLAIGGLSENSLGKGRLVFSPGDTSNKILVGKSNIALRTWNHVVQVRDGLRVLVFLNGSNTPEIDARLDTGEAAATEDIIIGGRADGQFNFEGRIGRVAIYDRPLSPDEIARHYAAADRP
jgi:hypothetical protein